MIKGATDYLEYSVAMAKGIGTPDSKEPLFHYTPTAERDILLELQRQYSRNELLLNEAALTSAGKTVQAGDKTLLDGARQSKFF